MSNRTWEDEPVKDTPVGADQVLILDSEDFDINKLVSLNNLQSPFLGTINANNNQITNLNSILFGTPNVSIGINSDNFLSTNQPIVADGIAFGGDANPANFTHAIFKNGTNVNDPLTIKTSIIGLLDFVFGAATRARLNALGLDMLNGTVFQIQRNDFSQNTIAAAANVALDLDSSQYNLLNLTQNITGLTTSNRQAGKIITVLLAPDAANRMVTLNPSWKLGPLTPPIIDVSSPAVGRLDLYCYGPNEADILANYVEFGGGLPPLG